MPTCLSEPVLSESDFVTRPKHPRNPLRQTIPSRVTLIIGILCKDCVVMACDTQVTLGSSKRTDGTKLREVEFGDMSALIAQAGSLTHTNRYIDILSREVKNSKPQNAVEVGELLNAAMETFRAQLRASNFNCSAEKLDAIIAKGIDCRLMLGFCLNDVPCLLSISLAEPIYRKCDSHFEAEGSGSLLGEYLLSEHSTPEMKWDFASTIAVYTVEVVKKYDLYCSGKTTVGIATGTKGRTRRANVRFLDQKTVTEYADLILKAEGKTRRQRNNIIHREFARQRDFFIREVMHLKSEDDLKGVLDDHPNAPEWGDEEG